MNDAENYRKSLFVIPCYWKSAEEGRIVKKVAFMKVLESNDPSLQAYGIWITFAKSWRTNISYLFSKINYLFTWSKFFLLRYRFAINWSCSKQSLGSLKGIKVEFQYILTDQELFKILSQPNQSMLG